MANPFLADGEIRPRTPYFRFSAPAAPEPLLRVTGLTLAQAEDLLDWLEAHGYREYQLWYTAGKGFTVSYAQHRGGSG